jgi:uncharacterized protein (TIGR02118 family)
MVKAVVLYRPPDDADAFERYYADTHTALATAIPGLKRFEAAQGIATPDGSELPYISASPNSHSRTWTRYKRASDPRKDRPPSTTSRTSPPAA